MLGVWLQLWLISFLFLLFPASPHSFPDSCPFLSVHARFVTKGHCHCTVQRWRAGKVCTPHSTQTRTVPLGTVCTRATDVHAILLGVCLYTTTRPFQLGRGGAVGGELGVWGALCVHSLLNVSEPCSLCIHQLLYTVTVQCWLFIETAFTYIYVCMYGQGRLPNHCFNQFWSQNRWTRPASSCFWHDRGKSTQKRSF